MEECHRISRIAVESGRRGLEKSCQHEWEISPTYGVWGGHGFGVMECAQCKSCHKVEYVSFDPEDQNIDGPPWVNPDFKMKDWK